MSDHPKAIKIGNKRWRLSFERLRGCDGYCDSPDKPNKGIHVHAPLLRRPKRLMTVAIHECLHAEGWPLDEAFVETAAEDIGRILWSIGFRFVPDDKESI
jgi:hypothetical protein